jgi:hypothetical protein
MDDWRAGLGRRIAALMNGNRCLALVVSVIGVATLGLAGAAVAGAWGEGSFDNDDALDWAIACAGTKSIEPVRQALQRALDQKYLEAPDGSKAIAAAEVLAATRGKASPKLPSGLAAWTKRHRAALVGLSPLAIRALVRVRDPKVSELRGLWDEQESKKWLHAVAELESRLR